MSGPVAVVGAGFVGVSIALHLQQRGVEVVLIDKGSPGRGTSFGNAGVIQHEAVAPYAFPRNLRKLVSVAFGRGLDIRYHPSALPQTAGALARYWWHSSRGRHRTATRAYATLIAQSLNEYRPLLDLAGGWDLIRRDGWYEFYRTEAALDAALSRAEINRREFGVLSSGLDGAALARLEPALMQRMAGAVHWQDTWTVRDPGALVEAFAAAFVARGDTVLQGAASVARQGAGWTVSVAGQPLSVAQVVLATGPWSAGMARRLGHRLPLFVKRGYHMHYGMAAGASLNNWLTDAETGYAIAPMRGGVRICTGAELAIQDAPPTPVQLDGVESVARRLLPLGPRLSETPWLGSRPCTVDMLPVIGPAPGDPGLWFCFGHGHQGLTLGPASGRLIAEMILGEAPYVDPAPFLPSRFAA